MRRVPFLLMLIWLAILTACNGSGGASATATPDTTLPSYMRQGYERYNENGGIARPNNAIDVYIAYSPESQQYMPRIIEAFNRAYAEGRNPITGAALANGERPIYVRGQQPTSGSSGSLAQGIINALIAPNNDIVYHPTLFQPSVSHWLELVNYQTGRQVFDTAASQATALTPVVIAMWESRYNALRTALNTETLSWDDLLAVLNSPNGWQDFGLPDARRAVYYGHTDPNISSTGLSTTIGEYYACARQNGFTDRRLTTAAVNDTAVQDCVRGIEQLVRHYSRRTEDFLEYISRGPDYLDFLAVEETDLICLNRGAQQGDEVCTRPQEKLVAVYPEEGTFWHEHPFGILTADWVTAEQQEAARVFTQFVLTPDIQRIIMSEGFRPANPDVPLAFPFVEENGVDVNQPQTILDVPSAETIVAIQQSWSLIKKPADVLIVIDVSGSMNNEDKIGQARQAALTFLNGMESNNRVGLVVFSDTIRTVVPLSNFESVQAELRRQIEELRADGGTALYAALAETVTMMSDSDSEDRIRAVVVLSDGQDTASNNVTLNDAVNAIYASRDSANPVIVVPVAYGSDADVNALNNIARASNTSVQSGDPNNINSILELISSFF